MSLVVHQEHIPQALDLLNDCGALGLWAGTVDADRALIQVLLPAERIEDLSDRLSLRFGATRDFRVMLLAVEATVPEYDPPDPAPDPEASDSGDSSSKETNGERISREELYADIAEDVRLSRTFLVTVILSTVVAAIGLMRGDVAIIIGAMVIAPFLGPNMALCLATTLGDGTLALRALKVQTAGVLIALAFAAGLGAVLQVDPTVPELAGRTSPGVGDLILALASGSAGALAFTSGVPTALTGVMVAVALLPPLVAAGMLVGAGHPSMGLGAFLLYLLNVASVNLAGVVTFFVQGIRPRTYWKQDRARQAARAAMVFWTLLILSFLAMVFWLLEA
jgi:uncharacterized hydrophobic protein (TIGR00341 family)